MKAADVESLACDCASARIDLSHAFLAYADQLVAKAAAVSEIAQIARVEVRSRQMLTNKWRLRADQAAASAGKRISGGGSISAALSLVDKAMGKWSKDVEKPYTREMGLAYELARKAGHKKANGQTTASLAYQTPNFEESLEGGGEKVRKAKKKRERRTARLTPVFDLADEAAISDLHDDQMIWVGRHYDENVRATLREVAKPALVEGVSSAEAGKRMAEALSKQLRLVTVPGGFNGSDTKYFEGLASNTITTARVRGQIRSFSDMEIVTYEIMNPIDQRTTPICVHMNGKTFQVSQAVQQIETLSGATDPDFVRKHHPWLSMKQVNKISKGPGQQSRKDSDALAKAGLSLPGYHFRCRTTVDIA